MKITCSVFVFYASKATSVSGVVVSFLKLSICPVSIFKAAISIIKKIFNKHTIKVIACTRRVLSRLFLHLKLLRQVYNWQVIGFWTSVGTSLSTLLTLLFNVRSVYIFLFQFDVGILLVSRGAKVIYCFRVCVKLWTCGSKGLKHSIKVIAAGRKRFVTSRFLKNSWHEDQNINSPSKKKHHQRRDTAVRCFTLISLVILNSRKNNLLFYRTNIRDSAETNIQTH